MKWNGRYYRPGYGVNVYPKPEDSIKELLKPLGEKTRKGNVWIPVLNQPINVLKDDTTPVPPVSPSPTPTQTGTPTPTPTPSSTVPEPSPSPTPTGTPTPSPSTPPPIDYAYRTQVSSTSDASTYTFSSVNFGGAGMVVIAVNTKKATAGSGWNFTTVTIDGITATQVTVQGGFNDTLQAIYYAVVTNTTGDIVVNLNANATSISCGVWRVVNYTSTTPVYTGVTQGVSGTLSLTTSSLGNRSVGFTSVVDRNYSNNLSWTNATERYEVNNGELGNQQDTSGADFLQLTTGTRTVTSGSLTGSGALLQLAVWE
jgi:hypothetical protein